MAKERSVLHNAPFVSPFAAHDDWSEQHSMDVTRRCDQSTYDTADLHTAHKYGVLKTVSATAMQFKPFLLHPNNSSPLEVPVDLPVEVADVPCDSGNNQADHHEQSNLVSSCSHLHQCHSHSHDSTTGISACVAEAGVCEQSSSAHAVQQDWLYKLVTCEYLFQPCPDCSRFHSGREVLLTYYDMEDPSRGYCTYCSGRHGKKSLIQIRRSTYHEVVKAADVSRIADISGVQHYVINGSKVVFLRPRPQPRPPKGVIAPARCVVDGRQLMDHGSLYCSLRCKLDVEDPDFAARFPQKDAKHLQEGRPHIVHKARALPAKRQLGADAAVAADDDVEVWGTRSKRARVRTVAVKDVKQPTSPESSIDSGRSSLLSYRWQHRRKSEPIRSHLQ